MATRARWSAALPTLRLRALRLTSETASAVPTAYDPTRITSSGGASLWLEARASWALDRALFSEEEVRLARIARDIEAERGRLERRVLDLLWLAGRGAGAVRSDLVVPRVPPGVP